MSCIDGPAGGHFERLEPANIGRGNMAQVAQAGLSGSTSRRAALGAACERRPVETLDLSVSGSSTFGHAPEVVMATCPRVKVNA